MKKGTILIFTGLLLIAAALCIVACNLLDASRAGEASGAVLERVLPQIRKDPAPPEGRILNAQTREIEYPDYVLDPQREMPTVTLDDSRFIGVLEIPDLHIRVPVCDECTDENLRIAPCRYSGSIYLEDMVICAHNYAPHFGTLGSLRLGARVCFTDMDGNAFPYVVSEIETLGAEQVAEMCAGDYPLTLFTCTVGGQARIAVRCDPAE